MASDRRLDNWLADNWPRLWSFWHTYICWTCRKERVVQAAAIAYGRAVRKADKEAAHGRPPQQTGGADKYDAAWAAGNYQGRKDAAAAIELLDKDKP